MPSDKVSDEQPIRLLVAWADRGDARRFEVSYSGPVADLPTEHRWSVRVEVTDISWSADSTECDTLAGAARIALIMARTDGFR